jgi:GNAT superfamily N-acetyltransferase
MEKMNEKEKVEILEKTADYEMLEVFTQAFKYNPNMPIICEKPEETKKVIGILIALYGLLEHSICHGIREKDELVCAAFSVDTRINPIMFFIGIIFAIPHILKLKRIGLRCFNEFLTTRREMPKYNSRCLELMLFGTLPSYQSEGFGEEMLHFLYNYAKEKNYESIVGFTRPDKPAFLYLYKKHGWVIDKEFNIKDIKFAWVRIKI